jgi:hypothetical protein
MSKDRFRLLDPEPRAGVTSYAILDEEMGGIIAFAPVKAQGVVIVDALNTRYTVSVPAKAVKR